MKKRSGFKYIILAVAILASLAFLFYQNLSYEYTLSGEAVSVLEDCYFNSADYAVTRPAGGKNGIFFEKTGGDPQIYFDLTQKQGLGQIGGVELVMEQRSDPGDEMDVQVFYKKAGEGFSERHSVKTKAVSGEERVLVPLPLGSYKQLRIDIDGSFVLNAVNVCTGKMIGQPYISEKTVHGCLWYFPAVLIGFPLIFWAHGVRKSNWRTILFGNEPSPKREPHWDYMRILAAVLVILAHACSPMVTVLEETGGADWKRLLLVCGLSLGLTCNPLYVMLSGALLLNGAKASSQTENVASFYIRRASKVIIPLAAYYLLILSLNYEVSLLPPENLAAAFRRIVTGAPDSAPHLWLIYTIVSLYLVTPFLRVMVAHLSDKMLASLAVVIFVFNALTYYLPLFGMSFGAATVLAGWEGVFLMGYIITSAKRRGNWFVFAGVASFVIAVAVVFVNSANMNYVYNNTLPMLFMACGIFTLFLKYKEKFTVRPDSRFRMFLDFIVRMCSKYSYSIILIHWYVLFVIVQGKLHITALRFGCIGGIAVTVALTFMICLVMAIAFDNTVVIVCTVLFDRLSEKIMNNIEKHRVK